jgi:SAM-dependent methyltransferase
MAPVKQNELVNRVRFLAGIDVDRALYEHPRLTYRVVAIGNAMPFHAGSFDLVTANMVVEHVDDPIRFLSEIRRILRPGGRFIFHTTNVSNWLIFCAHLVPDGLKKRCVWYLEKRDAKDVFPTWYRMNTVSRIEKTVARSGFKIDEFQVNGTAGVLEPLGPLGWVEILLMKAAAVIRNGRYNSNIVCVLQRD